MTVIHSARWVLPIASPAIENGAVAVAGSKIAGVGRPTEVAKRFPQAQAVDHGAAALLPGFVNTHSHLELTVMRGFLENEENHFFSWLKKLTLARMAMTEEDLFVSATCGAIEAARAGITCLGDSSSAATQSMKALRDVGLRGIVYQESFGPDPNLAEEKVAALRGQIQQLRSLESGLLHLGVSPHAPYTVSARQLKLIARLAIDDKLPLMMHAAESQAEESLLLEGTGAFAEGLKRRGIPWQPPGKSTIEYLARTGVLETKPLLAHCVTVADEDIQAIKAAGASIAHCPKSNAKLGHGQAPFARFIGAGVNTGLGSDSVASNNNCDILEEARFAALLARASAAERRSRPMVRAGVPDDALAGARTTAAITAEQALFAATLGGARSLGLEDQIGALVEGMEADLVVVNLDGAHQEPISNPIDSLIFSSSGRDVKLTMVAGKEIYREGVVAGGNEQELLSRLGTTRNRLDQSLQQ